jgi:hypothetical protein
LVIGSDCSRRTEFKILAWTHCIHRRTGSDLKMGTTKHNYEDTLLLNRFVIDDQRHVDQYWNWVLCGALR